MDRTAIFARADKAPEKEVAQLRLDAQAAKDAKDAAAAVAEGAKKVAATAPATPAAPAAPAAIKKPMIPLSKNPVPLGKTTYSLVKPPPVAASGLPPGMVAETLKTGPTTTGKDTFAAPTTAEYNAGEAKARAEMNDRITTQGAHGTRTTKTGAALARAQVQPGDRQLIDIMTGNTEQYDPWKRTDVTQMADYLAALAGGAEGNGAIDKHAGDYNNYGNMTASDIDTAKRLAKIKVSMLNSSRGPEGFESTAPYTRRNYKDAPPLGHAAWAYDKSPVGRQLNAIDAAGANLIVGGANTAGANTAGIAPKPVENTVAAPAAARRAVATPPVATPPAAEPLPSEGPASNPIPEALDWANNLKGMGVDPADPNIREKLDKASASMSPQQWGMFLGNLAGSLLDAYGVARSAYGGVQRQTNLQKKFANDLIIEQQKAMYRNAAESELYKLEPETQAAIRKIQAEYTASGRKEVYVDRMNYLRSIGKISYQQYTNFLKSTVDPADMYGEGKGGAHAALNDLAGASGVNK